MIHAITERKLVLVEGRDDERFFRALLQKLAIVDVQVENYGGKDQLRREMSSIVRMSGFSQVEALGVCRDADDAAGPALQALQDALTNAGLTAPSYPLTPTGVAPIVTVWIIPGNNQPGELESLCMASVAGDAAISCIDQYLSCLQVNLSGFVSSAKARAHTFLASRPNPALRVGEAADAGHWPFDNPAFDEAKRFLKLL